MKIFKMEIVKTGSNKFHFRIKSSTSRILCSSENYTRKEMCLKTANPIAKRLGCVIKEIDIAKDYEL